MSGQKIGYIRVSCADQNIDSQLPDIELDRVFVDKVSSREKYREQLELMRDYVREGDHIYIQRMNRLARDVRELRNLVDEFIKANVKITFIHEKITFDGIASPMSILYLQLMGAFGEFERDTAKERQLEGIAQAKKKGVYKGRKPCLTLEEIEILKERASLGRCKAKIAREMGVSRSTVYTYIRK